MLKCNVCFLNVLRTCALCFCWMNEGHQYVKVQCLFFKCAENMCLVFLLDE